MYVYVQINMYNMKFQRLYYCVLYVAVEVPH